MGSTSGDGESEVPVREEAVVSPISTALRTVETELTEVKAEQQAYLEFGERVAQIQPLAAADSEPIQRLRTASGKNQSRRKDHLRNAFRETVMDVEHYERVYGEPLQKHVIAAFSADIATGFQDDSPTIFTEQYQSTLQAAIDHVVTQRELLSDQLQTEQESLHDAQTAIRDLLAAVGNASGVTEQGEHMTAELNRLAEQRQQTIRQQGSGSPVDGHDLYRYLYNEYDWTYPVLLSLTRFQEGTR